MTEPRHITSAADALDFALGGAARFTLVSQKTGKRYTYRIKASDDRSAFFVSLLTGPNNTQDYTYLGFLKPVAARIPGKLIAGKKGNPTHPAFKGLDWALGCMQETRQIPPALEFWHEGRCARCARVLTDPASIERGLGPECAGKA